MNMFNYSLATAIAGGIALSANAQTVVLVDETFDGYSTTAEMQANWGSGLGTLDTSFGNPAPSAQHPGGTVNSWQGSLSIVPTNTAPVILRADIYDTGSAGHNTVGFRTGANPLFEMGHYQFEGPDNYKARILNFAGNDNWVSLSGGAVALGDGPIGWNRWEATFTENTLTILLDIGITGVVDYSFFSEGLSANAFTDLRFGGPSNLSVANSEAFYDNIHLSQIPEPSTYAAIFGGLALLGAFVYRRRLSVKK